MKILNTFRHFSWFGWIMDMVILFLFIWIGLQQHEIVSTYWYPLLAVLPFWLSWSVTGLVTQAFDLNADQSTRKLILRILVAWTAALLMALGLRYLMFGKPLVMSFATVAFLFNFSLFILWRVIFARWYEGTATNTSNN